MKKREKTNYPVRQLGNTTAAVAVKTAEAIETAAVTVTTAAMMVKATAMMVKAAATLKTATMVESAETAAAVMTMVEKAAVDVTDGKDGGRWHIGENTGS
jgi:hypothetical protein